MGVKRAKVEWKWNKVGGELESLNWGRRFGGMKLDSGYEAAGRALSYQQG